MRVPADAADGLGAWIRDNGHDACADTLPDDFETRLPLVLVRTLGGSRTWPVLDTHRLGVDVYADSPESALREAREVFSLIDSINDDAPRIGGVQTYRAEFGGLPQLADDPAHPSAPMCTFICQVSCRALES